MADDNTILDGGLTADDPAGVRIALGQASDAQTTAAFQAALDAGDVVLAEGTYRVGYVTYEGSASRRVVALPDEQVTIVQTDIRGVFSLRGGWDDLGSISSIAAGNVDGDDEGTTNTTVSLLTMGASVSVTKGDIVKVVSDDRPYGYNNANQSGQRNRRGEYSMVALTSSGTTVSLSNQLVDTYTTSPKLARLWDTTFEIEGDITFTADSGLLDDTGYSASIELRAAKHCKVNGVTFTDTPGRAIANFTYGSSFNNLRFKNLSNRPSLSHYGYGIHDGGWETRISDCHGENGRHLVSEGSNDVTAGSSNYEYYGGGWFGIASDCTATGFQNTPFDTHETAYGYTFDNCKAFGSFQGASSGGGGVSLRGRAVAARNCEVAYCYRGIGLSAFQDGAVENCKVYGNTYSALEIGFSSADDPAITEQTGARVLGGYFEAGKSTSTTRVVQISSAGGLPTNLDIESATFVLLTSGSGSMYFDMYAANKVRMDNCTLDNRKWTTAGTVPTPFFFREAAAGGTFTSKRLKVLGGPHITSAMQLATAAVSCSSRLRFYHYDYEATNASAPSLTIGHANLSDFKTSGSTRIGTAWYQKGLSSSQSITAATSASLSALGNLLDEHVYCRFTGSNGAVTVGSLPTPEFLGQRITFVNKSNGVVTIPSVTPTIPVDGSLEMVYGLGVASWHVANVYTAA